MGLPPGFWVFQYLHTLPFIPSRTTRQTLGFPPHDPRGHFWGRGTPLPSWPTRRFQVPVCPFSTILYHANTRTHLWYFFYVPYRTQHRHSCCRRELLLVLPNQEGTLFRHHQGTFFRRRLFQRTHQVVFRLLPLFRRTQRRD